MAEIPELNIGDLAPDFSLPSSTGGTVSLADYRGKSHVILFFVREFIWMQCRSYSAQLGRHNEEFKAAGAQVLIILGDPVDRAVKYADLLKLPFPVLADPRREVYHRYGLQKAAVLIQRTATVLLDKTGVIRYQKRVTNPMTWLQENVELLQAVKGLN